MIHHYQRKNGAEMNNCINGRAFGSGSNTCQELDRFLTTSSLFLVMLS
jgi:hypothetical protein